MRFILLALSVTLGLFGCAAVPEGDELPIEDVPAPHRDRGSRSTDSTPSTTMAAELPSSATDPASPNRAADSGAPKPAATDAGAGATAPKPPSQGPAPSAFGRLDVRYPVNANGFVAQCDSPTAQLVWSTSARGPDADSRWGEPRYTQVPGGFVGCGAKKDDRYPLVFTSEPSGALPDGTYVAKCVAKGVAEVYRIDGELSGHPSASFAYPTNWGNCQ